MAPAPVGAEVRETARARRGSRVAERLRTPEAGAALLGLAFIAITVVWLVLDQASPDGDMSRHLNAVWNFRHQFGLGHELYWFRFEPKNEAIYPPLTYLIGVAGTIGGYGVNGPVIAVNLVAVPLLVAGCFGVAKVVYGRRAGLLAAAFALAVPVTIGQFHLFMLDLPLAAFVAASAWALLETDHFARRRVTLVAAVLVGLGMLTKQSFPVFVGPFLLVLLARGGWRQWRNVALFAVVAGVICLPWYIQHLDGLRTVASAATGQGSNINAFGSSYTRFSLDNFAWYGWTLMNVHYLLPLTLFYLVGLVATVVRWVRTRTPAYAPELVVGSLSGYLGVALIFGFQDARYSIPAMAFVAAIGVGWIVTAPRRVAIAATAVLGAVLVANTIAVNTGAFGRVELSFGEQKTVAGENKLVLLADNGYTARAPQRLHLEDILNGAKRDGIPNFTWDNSSETVGALDPSGLSVLAQATELPIVGPGDRNLLRGRGITLKRLPVPPGGPQPCGRFLDGAGLYAFRGAPDPRGVRSTSKLYCPL